MRLPIAFRFVLHMNYPTSESSPQNGQAVGDGYRVPPYMWLIVFGLAILPKLVMIVLGGANENGDAKLYGFVAANIVDNNCVSMSHPLTGDCIPHWGGNQLPGYPWLIAFTWTFIQRSTEAVLVSQSMIYALCVLMLARALLRAGIRSSGVLFVALVLGVSPSLVGWSRSMLTETLSAALAILLLSELIVSAAEHRLRPIRLGLILACGFFVRYDFVLMAIPVAVVGFRIHSPMTAIRKGLIVFIVAAVPVAGWTVRSLSHGLPPTPPMGITPAGEQLPNGILNWVGTWLDDQYDLGSSVWALVHFDYENFTPPPKAFKGAIDRREVSDLLTTLRTQHNNSPPPSEIDMKFDEIAERVKSESPMEHWIYLRLRRSLNIWGSPFPSMGWPAEIDVKMGDQIKQQMADGGLVTLFDAAAAMPVLALTKGAVALHRYVLLALCGFFLVWSKQMPEIVRSILWLAVIYTVARTFFFANTLLLETRYMVPALAWMDIAVALCVYGVFGKLNRPKEH